MHWCNASKSVDPKAKEQPALHRAAQLAQSNDVELDVIEVMEETWLQSISLHTGYIWPKKASVVIPWLAKRHAVDLVVMGPIGRSGIPGLFIGNTAERILNRLACSILTIKPPGFVSPVSSSPT